MLSQNSEFREFSTIICSEILEFNLSNLRTSDRDEVSYVSSEVLSGQPAGMRACACEQPESTSELTYSVKLWVSLFAYSCCLLPANTCIAEWVLIQQYSENFFLYHNSQIKICMHTLFLEQFFYLFTTSRPTLRWAAAESNDLLLSCIYVESFTELL